MRGRPRPRPAQFYGSREPDHEDRGGLSAGGQRVGRRGCLQSDYRRPAGGQCAQRSAATCAPGRAAQGQYQPTGARSIGRCRLLLGSQPPGTKAAVDPWLLGHRSAIPRTGRDGRNPYAPRGTRTRAMPVKLRRGTYRSRYRLRTQTVEPVFGQIKQARGFRQMLLRGLDYVAQAWSLVCLAHNFLKLANARTLRGSARNDRADMS